MAFIGTLACLAKSGHAVTVAGKTTNDAKHLEIDFLHTKSDQDNLILHLCMRLDKQTLTINTKIDGVWSIGHQIKLTHISAGDAFKVQILLMMDEFFISFENGVRCTYPYRTNIDQIRLVRVSADVEYITQFDQTEAFGSVSLIHSNALLTERNWIFTNNIPRNFIAGDVIVMKGVAYGDETGDFSIFLCGRDSGQTIFKLNARFEDKRVIYAGDIDVR